MLEILSNKKCIQNGLVKGLLNEGTNNHEDSTSEWATTAVR